MEDMDASCISYDAEKNPLDFIWFQNLGSTEDSIYHAGDDCTYTGNVNEPNEVIHVALGSLSGEISSIVFVVNSYAGETFADISSVFCNVVNKTTNDEVARYDLSTEGKDCNGFIIAKLFRLERQWFFSAIGELYSGGHCNLEEIEAQARTFA